MRIGIHTLRVTKRRLRLEPAEVVEDIRSRFRQVLGRAPFWAPRADHHDLGA